MLRSMFAGVSGLRSHQTMMDVTGNNIANINTNGFKASRVTFQETLVQTMRGGTEGTADTEGGTNPMQIGLGSKVGATDSVFGQGASQLTGRALDVAIQGEGFFAVEKDGAPAYTRAGALSIDSAGNLVGAAGELILGWTNADRTQIDQTVDPAVAPAAINIADDVLGAAGADGIWDYSDLSIGGKGEILARNQDGVQVRLGTIALARFPNPSGLERAGNSLYLPLPTSGNAQIGIPGDPGFGRLDSGTLEMSNVELAEEFTNLIMAQRGFQANSRVVTTSDEMLQELVNIKR